ncbi:MAG: phosphoribosylglycinamide formyltransferase [Candidatus Omnitrophica bacterium]|nr:phosphoribosylglycinamide formyltransferase [Candidatus Omnitrophota bacterium]
MNIAVLVSGNGSNLQAISDADKKNELSGGKVLLVISDNPKAFALERAKKSGIKTVVLEKLAFQTREEYDEALIKTLKENNIELVVLAGFMRILTERFIDEYENRVLNIHPALLPSFKGANGIKDALKEGVKITGVTVHFVEKEVDSGPVILQKSVRVEENDTLDSLEEKIHRAEHEIYPKAIRLFVEGRLKIENKIVKIKEERKDVDKN